MGDDAIFGGKLELGNLVPSDGVVGIAFHRNLALVVEQKAAAVFFLLGIDALFGARVVAQYQWDLVIGVGGGF